jgi:membrane-anchored protein YejM (alkaline phosphatase superfamily)
MTDNSVNRIKIWWLLNYGFSLLLGVAFVRLGTPTGALAWGYAAAVWLTYALVYLLPAIALGWLLYRLMYPRWPKVYWLSAVLLCGISYLLIFADGRLFELFGFHINSFVINLVTTPGGIESLGNSQSAELTFALIGLVLMLVPALGHAYPGNHAQYLEVFTAIPAPRTKSQWWQWNQARFVCAHVRALWCVPGCLPQGKPGAAIAGCIETTELPVLHGDQRILYLSGIRPHPLFRRSCIRPAPW